MWSPADGHENGVAFHVNYQPIGSRRGSILEATPYEEKLSGSTADCTGASAS